MKFEMSKHARRDHEEDRTDKRRVTKIYLIIWRNWTVPVYSLGQVQRLNVGEF